MTPRIIDRLGRVKWEHYSDSGYLHVSYVIEAPPYLFPEELEDDRAILEAAARIRATGSGVTDELE